MKLVYLAGPYRSKRGLYGVKQNIATAEGVAVALWQLGLAVICPHKNTALLDGSVDEAMDEQGTVTDDSVFFRGDLLMLSRCDAIVMMPTWKQSIGAMNEHDYAEKLGIPVFYLPDDVIRLEEFAQSEVEIAA